MSTPPRLGKERPNTYEWQSVELVEIGRAHNTLDQAGLAAEFYRRHRCAPLLAALDVAELILRGESDA